MTDGIDTRNDWVEIGRIPPAELAPSPCMFVAVMLENVRTGELRIDVQIPNAGSLRFPEDLPSLTRRFAWVMSEVAAERQGDLKACAACIAAAERAFRCMLPESVD